MMKLAKHQKLLFIGDSITDCERIKPVGEGLKEALGHGYVSIVDALLTSTYPELGIRVVNMGISGHTVRDLKERWKTDVIDQKPDWLVVMIGTNDVWRQFDSPLRVEEHVGELEYEDTLRQLVSNTKPLVKGIVLMTPFFLEPLREDMMRRKMDQYGEIVKKVAQECDTLFVNTQEAFEPLLAEFHSSAIAWDRVHPNRTGHMVLARSFLNVIGFEWSR